MRMTVLILPGLLEATHEHHEQPQTDATASMRHKRQDLISSKLQNMFV